MTAEMCISRAIARALICAALFGYPGCVDDGQVDKTADSGGPDGGDAGDTDTVGPGDLTVTFIDVGQGDSILLELPDGEVMLVDGGDNGAGFGAVLPLLDDKEIEVIDLMVLTHPHKDHCGGLDEVLAVVDVLEIWENGEILGTASFSEYAAARDAEGALVDVPDQGYEREYGEVQITVLNREEGYEDENNDSLVLMVELGDLRFLLTGDVETEEQADLSADYGADLDCDVLKVPHHGSFNFDPQFIDLAAPEFAVISSGVGNEYGHPHQEAIDAYLEAGALLCRTDESGDIVARTDGNSFAFDCQVPHEQ
jgi:competence protein ComEC